MAEYTFPAQCYRDAFPFVSYDPTRTTIGGVLLAADGTIVATDGHTLLAMQLDAANRVAPPHDVIIPAFKALFAACKATPREATKHVVIDQPDPTSRDVTIDVVHAATTSAALEPDARSVFTLRAQLCHGDYPRWREIVPAMPETALASAPSFDARYLAKFGDVARNETLRVIPSGDECRAAFVDLGREDAFGVIMPKSYDPRGRKAAAAAGTGFYTPLPVVPAWARRAS